MRIGQFEQMNVLTIKGVQAANRALEITEGDMGLWFAMEDFDDNTVSMKVSKEDCVALAKVLLQYGETGKLEEVK